MPVAVPCLLAAVVRRRIDGRFRDLHAVDLMIAVIRERCDQHHVGACQTEAVADLRIFVGGRADLGRIVGDGPRRLSAAKSPRPGDSSAVIDIPAYVRKLSETGLFSTVNYSGYSYDDGEYSLMLSCVLKGAETGGEDQ